MTVAKLVVILVRRSAIVVTFVTWGVVNPVTEPTGLQDAVQVKLVPVTSDIKVTLNEVAEQIATGGGLVRWGEGLTVTMKFVT